MKRAVVLSGGGSKGAYQIGVWKALRRLGKKYDIVTGTSIGAVNGILMVQKEYHKAEYLWKNIGFSELFDVKFDDVKTELDIYKKFAEQFIKNGGISTTRIHDFISKAYNEKKFYRSNIDYGIVTFSVSKMQPKIVMKSESKEKLLDYVMASSACYPAFQSIKIDDDKYVDGGYYDNLPINLAIEMGAEEIIAIDLGAIGIKKTVSKNDATIISIVPKNDIGSFLMFDKKTCRKSINYGYNDTMKVFCKLDGDKYTYKKSNLIANYTRNKDNYVNQIENVLTDYENEIKIVDRIIDLRNITDLYTKRNDENISTNMNEVIEYAGNVLGLDTTKIYDIKKYNKLLKVELLKREAFSRKYIKSYVEQKQIKELLNTSAIIRYIYNEIMSGNDKQLEIYLLASLFPKEFLSAIYISII